MNKRDAIEILRRHQADLRARGIVHAALFGSVARGEAGPQSDLDIMIELAPDASLDIFAYVELKNFIAALFPGPVDVVNRDALKSYVRPPATADSIYAFDSPVGPLTDIRENIGLAFSFIGQVTIDQFLADRRTVYAVTRCLEIISEASRRLPPELKARHPQIRWQGMAGAGNVYRHDYELILDKAVWDTVHESLEPLLSVVEEELRRLAGG